MIRSVHDIYTILLSAEGASNERHLSVEEEGGDATSAIWPLHGLNRGLMLDLMLHIWEARARFPAWFDAAYYDGVTTARGHGSASSSLSAVRLGSGRNLCPPRFCVRRVSPSSVKCGARVWGTMTTDVYQQDEHNIVQRRKEEHESGIDLKQWMHEQGLPKCKVALAEHRPWEGDKGRPIHYVVASQDLQPGEVALTVPKELVVTLEKVLGDETIGMAFLGPFLTAKPRETLKSGPF